MNRRTLFAAGLMSLAICAFAHAEPATRPATPTVGDRAPDFSLDTIDGKSVRLSELNAAGSVVVVELRGWVGYQCPLCTKQVADLLSHADAFKQAGATIVLAYPGPADGLKAHAEDFTAGKGMPENVRFVLDPGLVFVNAWGLRWDKPGETAYPATFAIDRGGVVRFAHVSHSHGDRVSSKQVLDALAAAK